MAQASASPRPAGQHIGTDPGWCLVMAVWGSKYGAGYVNELAAQARRLSPGLERIVLLTDRPRPDVDPAVTQVPFPDYFNRPDFFRGGLRAKLAVFSAALLPPDRRCVFLDLDTIVLGDVGRIAALVQAPDDLFMLPPAGLGFGRLRALADRLGGGRKFPIGNSSVLAWHSSARPNLAETFQRLHAEGTEVNARHMQIDDAFISWFGRGRVRGVPNTLAVMFRREFLSRSPALLALRARLPAVRRRRAGLAVVTLNGLVAKPENLAALPEGAPLVDEKGRRGRWSGALIGPARDRIADSCRWIVAGGRAENDKERRT